MAGGNPPACVSARVGVPGGATANAVAWWRLPFLAAGFASLFAGVHAGLARLGWDIPLPPAELAAMHGPLMVSGFFGTLISLERAVALGRPWAYLAPAAAGLGGVGLLANSLWPVPPLLFVTAAAVLCIASFHVVARQPTLFTLVLAAGAVTWLIANVLWLSAASAPAIVPWWALFFLLTIAGERLELTRLMPPRPRARILFAVILVFLVLTTANTATDDARALGLGWIALAAWLGLYDIARHAIRRSGLPRFTAVCLLSGYGWLGGAGAIVSIRGLDAGSLAYDAALHALFLGFVFAMVFGHAPIIFPAILRRRIAFGAAFYIPLMVLNLSLAARLIGDLSGDEALRQIGGMGNAVAVGVFLLVIMRGVLSDSEARSEYRDMPRPPKLERSQ